MTNNKNNDEIKSTHPEAFEDIKVSDSVPNSYKELLELQKPKIESIDDLVSEGKIDPEKAKFLKLCTETFQSVLDLLNKLKSSPGQDIFIATMLIQRVYLFNSSIRNNITFKSDDEIIDNAKFKEIIRVYLFTLKIYLYKH